MEIRFLIDYEVFFDLVKLLRGLRYSHTHTP